MPAAGLPEPWTKIQVPPQAAAYEGHADTDPVRLWYWDTGGEGEVIVLNHPGTQSSECWKYQQPVLAAAGYRVIAWSRRGFYKTERGPQDDQGNSAEDQRKLLDHLGIETCHMIGAAAGGITSLHFALAYPERVRSLVIAGSILFPEEPDFLAMFRRVVLPRDHGTSAHFVEIGPSYRAANPKGLAAWIELEHLARPDGQPVTQPWGATPATWARIGQLQVPVLLLTGDADHLSPASINRLFTQHFPRCELAVIDEAGHAAYWEQPDAFNEAVLDFLGRKGAAPAPQPPSTPWRIPNSRAPRPRIVAGPVAVWEHVPIPEQAPVTAGYADTHPVPIWYWDTGGEGEPIVLCHPWSQSSECWHYQQPVFAAAGYRVIGWSQRGFYKTARGPQDDPGTSSGDLHQLVDFLGLDRFHLVGCAAGGCTAISYAIDHPDRLASLILSGSILLPDEAEFRRFMGNLAAAPAGVKTNVPVEFREVGASYRAGNPEGFAAWKAQEQLAHPDGYHVTQPWGAVRTFETFAAMTVPTLLQTGDTDMSGTASLQRLYARHFPNCERLVINEAGHAAYWEQPEAFNASVLDFVGRHPVKPRGG